MSLQCSLEVHLDAWPWNGWQGFATSGKWVDRNAHQWRDGLLTFCLAFVLAGCAITGAHTPADRSVSLPSHPFHFNDGGQAPTYALRLGNDETPETLLFFISGSGCASVSHRLTSFFAPISDAINAKVFALQKRGIDAEDRMGRLCSPSFHGTDHLGQTIADQREFINAQLALITPMPDAIVLLGASEGAVVAARIAATDSRITHLGLIGGGGTTMRKNLRMLSENTWYLRNAESAFATIDSDPENTSAQVWGHSYKYWASILDVNIGDELIKLDIPIVAAMGGKDESVPVESARELENRFRNAGKTNLQLLVFPDANHRLEDEHATTSNAAAFLLRLAETIQAAPTGNGVARAHPRTPLLSSSSVARNADDGRRCRSDGCSHDRR